MIDAVPPEKRLDYLDQQLNQRRQVRLKTCADVYNHWRSCKRLYKKAPKDGVEFQVDYIDTGLALDESIRASAPIALALHGAPGSYHDFALLIHHLTQQNVRVIAPNFPEYTATVRTKVLFRHSADEKAAYLRDFLKAINVTTIDLLVSHSSAIFPTLLILLNANREAIAKQKASPTQQEQPQQDRAKRKVSAKSSRGGGRKLRDGFKAIRLSSGRKDDQLADSGQTANIDVDKLIDNCTSEINGCGEDELAPTIGVTSPSSSSSSSSTTTDEAFEDDANSTDTDKNNNCNCASADEDERRESRDESENNEDSAPQTVDSSAAEPLDGAQPADLAAKTKRRDQDAIARFDEPIEIRAVALFNPAGHRLPKSMKPTWFKCGSVHIYQHKLGRSLFRKLGPAFLTVVGVPVRVDNMDNVMLSATVMRNSKCQRVVRQLEQLSEMKVPTLLVFSENDKLIEKEIFYEMTQFMKLDPKNFDVFNNDGDIELSQSVREDWIRVMVFKAGGHYAYSNYAKTVNKAVSDLLRRVVKQ